MLVTGVDARHGSSFVVEIGLGLIRKMMNSDCGRQRTAKDLQIGAAWAVACSGGEARGGWWCRNGIIGCGQNWACRVWASRARSEIGQRAEQSMVDGAA
jgi:hypothetical protein